jgi:hypothetical protein
VSDPVPARNHVNASGPRRDVAICLAIAIIAGTVAWGLAWRLAFTIQNIDVWFDTDSLFIFEVMTDRWSPHHDRNNLHPIFPLVTYPMTFASTRWLGLDRQQAALAVVAVTAALWTGLMYATLRLMRRPIGVSVLFTAIGVMSTGGVLFLGLIERHVAGSVTILACVAAFVAYERRLISATWLVLAAAATLGVTITNFLVGAVALLLALGLKKGTQACVNAVFIVIALSTITPLVFPRSTPLLDLRWLPYGSTFMSLAGTLHQRNSAFWFHSMVVPEPRVETKPAPYEHVRYLSVQRVGPTHHWPVGLAALSLWGILLALGAWKTYRRFPVEKIDVLLAIGVVGHYVLFLFFGSETILYAPTYVPLMLLMVSAVLRPPGGRWMYVLTLVFLGLLAWNNIVRLQSSLALARSLL